MLNNIYIGFLLFFFVTSGNIYSQKLKKYERFYSEGNEMFRIGEFDKAIDLFNKSLKLNPSFCPSIYKLGLSYKKNNNFKKYFRNYDFHNLYKELLNFCTVDLSAFYFDIRKDTLYCCLLYTSPSPRDRG